MEALIPIGVVLIVVTIIGAAIYTAHVYEKKRTAALQEAAEAMGLQFLPQGDDSFLSRMTPFGLFNQGHSRKMANLISGETDEVRISLFDYKYTTGSGKQKSTHQHTIVALESPKLEMPSFSLRPENFLDRIGGLLGFQDIDFDDHPVFSEQFVLKGADEEAIRQFFTRPILDFFGSRPGIIVEADHGRMIFYRTGRRKPDELQDLFAEAYQVYGTIVDRQAAEA